MFEPLPNGRSSSVPYVFQNILKRTIIYSYVEGKPILIIKVFDKLRITNNLKEILNYMLKNEVSKLKDFLKDLDYIKPKVIIRGKDIEIKKEEIIDVLKLFKDNYEINADGIPKVVYVYLVKENILFLNPIEGTLRPQSYLVWNAIKRLL